MRLYSAPIETNFDHSKCAEIRNSTSSWVPGDVIGFFGDIFLPTVPWPWGRLSP